MSKYYEAPSQKAFDEIRATAIRIWENPNYGYHESYVSEKVGHIKPLDNIKDNYAHIIAMFDDEKQMALINLLSNETKAELFPANRDERRGSEFERLRPRSLW